jgi:predicted Zn-dependent peptidase
MLSLENTSSRMNHMARQEIYFGRQFTLDEILEKIESVSAADVQRIAAQIFKGELAVSNLGHYRPKPAHLKV